MVVQIEKKQSMVQHLPILRLLEANGAFEIGVAAGGRKSLKQKLAIYQTPDAAACEAVRGATRALNISKSTISRLST